MFLLAAVAHHCKGHYAKMSPSVHNSALASRPALWWFPKWQEHQRNKEWVCVNR